MVTDRRLWLGLFLILGTACRTTRDQIEILDPDVRSPALVQGEGTESVASTLKITAISLPPSASAYDRLDLSVQAPNKGDKRAFYEDYQLKTGVPVLDNTDYIITLRAYAADEILYSNEYCQQKRSIRTDLGVTQLTVSLCEIPQDEP